MTIDKKILKDLRGFDWQKVLDYGYSLTDLNDAQLRFFKGLAIEKAIEHASNGAIKYIGEEHRDFHWPKRKLYIEGKSQFSDTLFTKKAQLRGTLKIKLSNSNGTNKKGSIDPNDVADLLLLIRQDGVVVIDKQVVVAQSRADGDGFVLTVKSSDVELVVGPLSVQNVYKTNLKEELYNAIERSLSSLQ
jgi:hypothetical protein